MDDFVWKLLAGPLEIQRQPAEGTGSWLFMSEDTRTASTIATYSINSPVESNGVVKIIVSQISGEC